MTDPLFRSSDKLCTICNRPRYDCEDHSYVDEFYQAQKRLAKLEKVAEAARRMLAQFNRMNEECAAIGCTCPPSSLAEALKSLDQSEEP